MMFACAAAAAAAAKQSPTWFLSGAYHHPLPGRTLLHAINSAGAQQGAAIDGEALTVALDVIQAEAVMITLLFTLIIFFFLAFCVCSKKDDSYDEFELSQGITTVKICHDGGENGVSLIPRINGSGTLSLKATDETSEASSRYTLKRELPAIPTSTQENIQGASNIKVIGGVQVLPAGAIAPGGRAAVVKECISSPEGDHPDLGKERKEKMEHPYAKVSHGGIEEAETDNYDIPKTIVQDTRKKEIESRYQSVQYPSERLQDAATSMKPIEKATKSVDATSHLTASVHSTFSSHSTTAPAQSPTSPTGLTSTSPIQPQPTQSDIPAAMAISGRQPANEDMPYMTPPALQPGRGSQQHFSGDSQDSKGYISISVREPLAVLRARQNAEGGVVGAAGRISGLRSGVPPAQGPEGEGYYMTVSDDSADEMYACIYEGSRGTGSETYAQIEPRTSVPSAQPLTSDKSPSGTQPIPSQLSRSQEQSPPAPPSVDSLRHVVHSRQASASSATSTGMGSPVAEKRGTRSPLPPLPQGDISLYSPPEPPAGSSQIAPKSPPKATAQFVEKTAPRSLDEMYAKVNKKTGHSRGSSAGGESEGGSHSNSRRGSADTSGSRWTSAISGVALKTAKDMTHSLVETRSHDASGINRAKSCDVSGAWGGLSKGGTHVQYSRTSGNYESIPSQGDSLYSGSDPGYETVKNGDPPYASVGPSDNYPGYERVHGSDIESEPGYETLKHKESEPGYETVSEVASQKRTAEAGYESVSDRGSSISDFEPGYETVASKQTSGYESVQEKAKEDYDPGYEELSHPSHPRTSSETDPNYEQLKFTSSRTSSEGGDNVYETVKKQIIEGNYELVSDYDTQDKPLTEEQEVFDISQTAVTTVPLYASVKKKESPKEEHPEPPPSEIVTESQNENFNVIMTSSVDKLQSQDELSPVKPQKLESTTPVEDSEQKHDEKIESMKDKKDILSDIDDLLESLSKPRDVAESPRDMVTVDDLLGDFSSSPYTVAKSGSIEISLMQELMDLQDTPITTEPVESEEKPKQSTYQVMDSPEEVELPPPGEEDEDSPELAEKSCDHQATGDGDTNSEEKTATPTLKKDKVDTDSPQPFVSVTFTAASPVASGSSDGSSPRSSKSSGSSKDEQSPQTIEAEIPLSDDVSPEVSAPPPPPPQFESSCTDECKTDAPLSNNLDDPLPPPPLPSLDDDTATASPPPPPPPLPVEVCSSEQELPPPPMSQDSVAISENINGLSPSSPLGVDGFESGTADVQEAQSSCSQGTGSSVSPLPPPLFPSSGEVKEEDDEESSIKGSINGSITVTVNPIAALEEGTQSVHIATTTSTVTPYSTAIGTSSIESHSSGSTMNGSNSVESVVTVDAKTGSDPATSVPSSSQAPALQHSSSTSSSSSESKHTDPNEGITSV